MSRGIAALLAVASLAGCGSKPAIELTQRQLPMSPMVLETGPKADRPPTSTEERALVAALLDYKPRNSSNACWRFEFRISRVDERWADGGGTFEKPYRQCLLFNGTQLMRRSGARWKGVTAFSSDPSCGSAPPGVMLSLYGACDVLPGPQELASRSETTIIRRVLARSEALRAVIGGTGIQEMTALFGPRRSFAVASVSAGDKEATIALQLEKGRWRILALSSSNQLDWCRVAPTVVKRRFSLRC